MVNSSVSSARMVISIDCRWSHLRMPSAERTVSLRPELKMVWPPSEFYGPFSDPSKRENRSQLPTSRELSDEVLASYWNTIAKFLAGTRLDSFAGQFGTG